MTQKTGDDGAKNRCYIESGLSAERAAPPETHPGAAGG